MVRVCRRIVAFALVCYTQQVTLGGKILATVRALGLFVGVWGVLALVAWGTGVLPSAEASISPESAEAEDGEGAAQSETDAEEPVDGPVNAEGEGASPDEDDAPAPVPVIAGEESADEGTSPPPLASPFATSAALRICDDALSPVFVTTGQLLGDDEPELVVSCGAEVNILGRAGGSVMRVAQVRDTSSSPARAANVSLADLGGDGRDDLLVGFLGPPESASASRLVLVPANERGGLKEAQVLAPIAALSMASAELDGRPGADLVALHQADGFGRRPSEAWVIAGGPSPVRTHRQILRTAGTALSVADLDGDTHADVLSADSGGVYRYSGDGAGRLGQGEAFAEEVASHLQARVREDERQIAWTMGSRLFLRLGDAAMSIDAGAEVRDLAFDEGRGVLLLLAQSWIRFDPEAASLGEGLHTPLPARLDALAFAVWGNEVAILARSETGVELVRLPLEGGGEIDESLSATPLADAPLSLRVDVP